MQAFRRLIFHRYAECVALDVMGEQRTIKDGHTYPSCDQKENRNRRGINQWFPSQRCEVTGLNRESLIRFNVVRNHQSTRLPRHSELRKQKSVNVGQLFNSLA